jgi:ATP-dependent DNA helicase RecG
LEQRGPGDFLGKRQSGFAELRMARLSDIKLIELARQEATALFERDPKLQQPENRKIIETMQRFWHTKDGDIS